MRLAVLFFVAVFAALALSMAARAQEAPPRSVMVSAMDTVRVEPDRAIFRFAVVTRARDPEAARTQNEAASRRALDAVRALAIPERQIQVRALRLQEEVEHRQGRRVVIGFIARRDVEVIIDEMDLLASAVAAAVSEGATEITGISYDLRDRRAAENEALRRAALRAREKADVLASTLGTAVRAVHSITEAGVAFPRPIHQTALRAMEMDHMAEPAPGAFAPGEIGIQATVQVVFELE